MNVEERKCLGEDLGSPGSQGFLRALLLFHALCSYHHAEASVLKDMLGSLHVSTFICITPYWDCYPHLSAESQKKPERWAGDEDSHWVKSMVQGHTQ